MSRRASDRWATPVVVVTLLLCGTFLAALVIVAVAWLAVRGIDPGPMLQTVPALVAAATGIVTTVLGIAYRRTSTNVQAQVGRLATGTSAVVEELDARRGRHAPERGTAPATNGSDLDQDAGSTAGPWRGPSHDPERYPDTPGPDLQDTAWFRQ